MAPRYNLVFSTRRGRPATANDLRSIARHVQEIDPEINAVVLDKGFSGRLRQLSLWSRPSLSLAMHRGRRKPLLPGRILASQAMLKAGEYRRLADAGMPVPKWTFITPGIALDPSEWGPYVVEKPDFGGLGAYVRIKRTTRVRYKPSEEFESGHFGRRAAMLVQQFIYTGEWPESFRVITLLGQVILCFRQRTVGRGKPLKGRWSFGESGGYSIVSNTTDMEITLVKDADVIALCETAHRLAFPDVPLLGFDVIRDAENGGLYILECHSHGPNWAFSSSQGRAAQQKNGVDFVSQFDALRKCARILAEATPRLAARRLPFQLLDGRWV